MILEVFENLNNLKCLSSRHTYPFSKIVLLAEPRFPCVRKVPALGNSGTDIVFTVDALELGS